MDKNRIGGELATTLGLGIVSAGIAVGGVCCADAVWREANSPAYESAQYVNGQEIFEPSKRTEAAAVGMGVISIVPFGLWAGISLKRRSDIRRDQRNAAALDEMARDQQ